jgi:hypothetical protein
MTLYNLKSALDDFRITKFTKDLDVESSYLIGPDEHGTVNCECPAGTRPTCRHRQMLPTLLAHHMVDSELFWDFERGMSVDANGNPARETVTEPAESDLTTEDIEALHDGLEKDFHHAMQDEPAVVTLNARVTVVPEATLPPGITAISLDDPATLHNAIADAIGDRHHSEACVPPKPAFGTNLPPGVRLPNQTGNWRRM